MQQAALARTAGAEQGDGRAGRDRQIEAGQDRRAGLIGDGYVAESDGGGGRRNRRSHGRGLRVVGQRLQAGHGRLGGLSVVIGGGQAPHRRIDLWRQRQQEEGARQAELLGRGEGQQLQQVEAAIDGDQGHGQRREEFQHGRGQEGDLQHAAGAPGQVVGGAGDHRRLLRLGLEGEDGGQGADSVEEEAGQSLQRLELTSALGPRRHAGQGHADDEGQQGEDQNAGREGADHGGDGDQQQRRHARRQTGGQKARHMAVQRLDALVGRGHGFGVGQPTGEGAVQDLTTQIALDRPGRPRADHGGALGQHAAHQQRADRQQHARRRLADPLGQGADGQSQSSREADRRNRIGDHQAAGQGHDAFARRQGRLQPLGRCGVCMDRLGRHRLSCSVRANRHGLARRRIGQIVLVTKQPWAKRRLERVGRFRL